MSEVERRKLVALEERRRRQEAALRDTREKWAALVEEVGQSDAGRVLGISRQAVHDRLRAIRRARG